MILKGIFWIGIAGLVFFGTAAIAFAAGYGFTLGCIAAKEKYVNSKKVENI